MRISLPSMLLLIFSVFGGAPVLAETATTDRCGVLPQQEFSLLHRSETRNLCQAYAGRVILVVNTASRCGYTPQLGTLETLYNRLQKRGFTVLGFPSDDFNQELEQEEDIASFCKINYGVTFPLFGKSSVRGASANPLYQQLIAGSGESPRWNFHKYLLDRQGQVQAVFPSSTRPDDPKLVAAIEALLD
ncbi:MAG: glutathione peroxidase [Pseudomonadota bacterium]|nr:glutathione peroxidase [Pseudomonadales bacterium]MDY6920826.1 glutathione peroxidase [Pseudomonadota bacterium]